MELDFFRLMYVCTGKNIIQESVTNFNIFIQ